VAAREHHSLGVIGCPEDLDLLPANDPLEALVDSHRPEIIL